MKNNMTLDLLGILTLTPEDKELLSRVESECQERLLRPIPTEQTPLTMAEVDELARLDAMKHRGAKEI